MAIKSARAKGARVERLAVKQLKAWGLKNPRRGLSQSAGAIEADVVCDSLKSFWVEVKGRATEGKCIYKWLEQAERDSKNTPKIPLVMYKANNNKFLIIADAEYILPILCGHT